MEDIILEGKGLVKFYQRNTGLLRSGTDRFPAVNYVDFALKKGYALGIVGESGSGKTTLARCITDISKLDGGTIYYKGEEMDQDTVISSCYRKNIRLIYQDSYSSFDPKKRLDYSLREALRLRTDVAASDYEELMQHILSELSLEPELLRRYPHELSGGQCQRMNIARALLLEPEILVLDEPVSALDITLQVQILELLGMLKDKNALSYIVISHDLAAIRFICDDICVMYQGEIIESGKAEDIFERPGHEYTRRLLS